MWSITALINIDQLNGGFECPKTMKKTGLWGFLEINQIQYYIPKPKVAIKATVRTKNLADMFFFDVVCGVGAEV